MNTKSDQPWFRAKWIGWGWYPASWQGWLITLSYVVLVIGFAKTIDGTSPPSEVMFTFVLPVVLLTAALVRLAYKKGEAPAWRWMGKQVSPRVAKLMWTISWVAVGLIALSLLMF